MNHSRRAWFALLVLGTFLACSDDSSSPPSPDPGDDAGIDAAVDPSSDSGADPSSDSGADPITDAGTDSGTDPNGDDASSDGGADASGGTQTIGAAGGQISSDGVSMTIPADALAADTTVSIARLDATAAAALPQVAVPGATSATLTSEVFAFTPHGTTFDRTVTVAIAHAGPGNTVLRLDDASDTTWEVIGSVFESGVATFPVWGFSIYAIANADGTPGCDPSQCQGGTTCVLGYDKFDKVERYHCGKSCSADAECPFELRCESPTSMRIGGTWCGKAPWRATGYCEGMEGIEVCHGVDGQNPQLTTCVAGECTDTVYSP